MPRNTPEARDRSTSAIPTHSASSSRWIQNRGVALVTNAMSWKTRSLTGRAAIRRDSTRRRGAVSIRTASGCGSGCPCTSTARRIRKPPVSAASASGQRARGQSVPRPGSSSIAAASSGSVTAVSFESSASAAQVRQRIVSRMGRALAPADEARLPPAPSARRSLT